MDQIEASTSLNKKIPKDQMILNKYRKSRPPSNKDRNENEGKRTIKHGGFVDEGKMIFYYISIIVNNHLNYVF